MNFQDLVGFSPTEARLYTLEARQRTDENRTISLYQSLKEEIDHLRDRPRQAEASPCKPSSSHRLFHSPERTITPALTSSRNSVLLKRFASEFHSEPVARQANRPAVTPPAAISRIFAQETVHFERLLGER